MVPDQLCFTRIGKTSVAVAGIVTVTVQSLPFMCVAAPSAVRITLPVQRMLSDSEGKNVYLSLRKSSGAIRLGPPADCTFRVAMK